MIVGKSPAAESASASSPPSRCTLDADPSAKVHSWIDRACIVLAFLAMMWWSWGAWPDALVDYGRELYVPWRIVEGDVLGRDVVTLYGPLSPYVNAAWFTMLGVSVRTLALCNAALALLMVMGLHSILITIADRLSAIVGAVTCIVLFLFGQFVIGNYNAICPYSHEAFHGLALSISAIWLCNRYLRSGRTSWLAGTGFCLGLLFLTKVELFAACAPAVATGTLAGAVWDAGSSVAARSRLLLTMMGCALIPPIAAWGLFTTAMPWEEALLVVCGSFRHVFNAELTSQHFYRAGMGLDDVPARLREMLTGLSGLAAIIGVGFAGGWIARNRKRQFGVEIVAVFGGVGALLTWLWIMTGQSPGWLNGAVRPLPVFLAITGGTIVFRLARTRTGDATRFRLLSQLVFVVFSLLLLMKMILNVRVFHYGFVLAMSGTMVLLAALLDWIPRYLTKRGVSGGPMRAAVLAAVGVALLMHIHATNQMLRLKNEIVGRGANAMLANPRYAPEMIAVMEHLAATMQRGETLIAFPEGVMMNYLMRCVNPTPYTTFLPSDMIMFTEHRLLTSLHEHPPDVILIVHRTTDEFGFHAFGRDYAQQIGAWIASNYVVTARAGDPPFQPNSRFGIVVMRKRLPTDEP